MLQALLVLVVGLGVVRVLRHWLSTRYLPTTSLDAGMRASATTLFGYAGVVVAIALAMSAMGVGLERIAWVASALSVGIGFGLQAVVQNFVSGLILLAERPVKVGDWVVARRRRGRHPAHQRARHRDPDGRPLDRDRAELGVHHQDRAQRDATPTRSGWCRSSCRCRWAPTSSKVRELLLRPSRPTRTCWTTPAPSVLLDGIDHGQLMFNATGYVNSPRSVARVRSALLFDVLKRLHDADIQLSSPPTMLISAAPGEVATLPATAPAPVPPAT